MERCKRCGDPATIFVDDRKDFMSDYSRDDVSGFYCCMDCYREERDVRTPFPTTRQMHQDVTDVIYEWAKESNLFKPNPFLAAMVEK